MLPDWMAQIDKSWTLFLDRDGVINRRKKPGYILNPSEFHVLSGVPQAICQLGHLVGRIIVVTNQQGIHKGLMQEAELDRIHARMQYLIRQAGGEVDAIYYCGEKAPHPMRKPAPGMALLARQEFPEINFARSIMVGDTESDLLFGQGIGMKTVWIENQLEPNRLADIADFSCAGLPALAEALRLAAA